MTKQRSPRKLIPIMDTPGKVIALIAYLACVVWLVVMMAKALQVGVFRCIFYFWGA
ncbi:hypothetical protein [Agarivorans sp. B2Z047]|uniref:hypothetical protein n=1 Tax=Agarivorans sp. B2Z047 TaxID=2652721 RepID=UPI0018835C27|nr:hypothetical protein [Agarivorans sp. B2Z047]UQN41893.1 hypothetical protein LQZ07_19255 [Agarivorans sp. B2Z047]